MTPWAHDSERRFVFTYHLSDDTFSIFEPQRPNSGSRFRGKYLERGRVEKPLKMVGGEVDYYDIEDFYIGSVLHVHGRKFEIIGADERVLNYLREREIPLPTHCQLSLRQYFKERHLIDAKEEGRHINL